MRLEDTIIYKGCVIRLLSNYYEGYYLWIYRNGDVVHTTSFFEDQSDTAKELSVVVNMIDEGEI